MSVMPAAASGTPQGSKYGRLIVAAKGVPTVSTIVVHPCDESSLRGAIESAEAGIIKAILVGPAARIRDTAARHNLNISDYEVVDTAPTEAAAATKGVELIHERRGEVLMKGSLQPSAIARQRSDRRSARRQGLSDRGRGRCARRHGGRGCLAA